MPEKLQRFERRVEEARAGLREVEWSDERADRARRAAEASLARRTRTRRIAAGMFIAAAAAPLLWFLGRPSPPPVARLAQPPASSVLGWAPATSVDPPGTLVLEDGSRVEPRGIGTRASVVEDTLALDRIALESGAAQFRVTKNKARVFRVEVGAIRIEVVGTTFVVERRDDGAVHVDVLEGRVRVAGGDHERELGAGEGDLFLQGSLGDALASASSVAPRAAAPDWRVLAQSGDYEAAYNAVEKQGGTTAVRDEANELLLAADVARLSGHPKQALPPLRRIASAHRADPRAVLATFTLGRVLLDDLGQPREAAAAFADAQALDPNGSLVEDALAREVEAWSRAGDATRAHERALLYLERHPNGMRARQVKKLANME